MGYRYLLLVSIASEAVKNALLTSYPKAIVLNSPFYIPFHLINFLRKLSNMHA